MSLSAQQKNNVNDKPFPYGNPVIKHMYTADAAPRVMPNGRVWMVTSVDHENGGGFTNMHQYHTFSSSNMVDWVDHGSVFTIWDVLGAELEPEGENWALWAPDMIYHHGKYYLYYPVSIRYKDKTRGNNGKAYYIGVAVSDSPDQHFKIINRKIHEHDGFDPSVFIDDDGQPYLYYGHTPYPIGGKLKPNMIEFAEEPQKIELGEDANFMEAFWMHKRNGIYYASFHTEYDHPLTMEMIDNPYRVKSRLDYSMGNAPLGAFKYKGILNNELGEYVHNGPKFPGKNYVPWRLTQSNHGGIVEFHGQEYLFYHTSALSSWRQDEFKERGTWQQRSVCIDKIEYNIDGSIVPVEQTIEGVAKVEITQAFKIKLDCEKAKKSGKIELSKDEIKISSTNSSLQFKDVDLGSGYYYFGVNVIKSGKGKVEVRYDNPHGQLLGTILLSPESKHINNGKAHTFLREAKGKRVICLLIKSEDADTMIVSNPEFFAGAPLQ